MEDVPVFSISPNPTAMFLTPALKEGVARFKRAIQRKQGLCAVLGGIGLGKSTFLRYVASNYEMDELYSISYLHDSRKCKTPFDFLKIISSDFGIPFKRSQIAQMGAIETFLIENYSGGKTTIVFVDEAQRLTLDTLELVRSLLNYETDTHKLIQFVVAGQLELRDKLLERRYEAFRSRIVAPLLMQPLSLEETRSMLQSRLESWMVDNPFRPEALAEIHALAGGIPRQILLLCQHSIDRVMVDGQLPRLITIQDVRDAKRDLQISDPEIETQAELAAAV